MIFQRKYGVTTTADFYCVVPVIKRGVVDFTVTGEWTPAAGDVRVSKDGGANWSNIGTLPTMIATGNNAGTYLARFVLADTELQCKQLLVSIGDAATKAIEDTYFIVETFGHASAMYPSDPTADNTDAESRLVASAKAIIKGTVGSGTNSTTTVSISGGSGALDPAAGATDQFKGRVILFAKDTTTANLRGQGAPIDGNSTTAITIAAGNALTTAAQNGDTFVIL